MTRALRAQEELRQRHGLWRRTDLEAWLVAAELDGGGFEELLAEEAAVAWVQERQFATLDQAVLSELRSSGRYAALAERARAKDRCLTAAGLNGISAAEAGVDLDAALARLGESTRLARGTRAFASQAELAQALLREILFLRIMPDKNGSATHALPGTRPAGSTGAGRD